jgi:hypothetical protein
LAAHSFDDSFDFKAGIGLANGHGIDLGGASDLSNAGKHVARDEAASRDEGADLIDELPIDRNPRGGVELKKNGASRHAH